MDCSLCFKPLYEDPALNLMRGMGDFIHRECPAEPPAEGGNEFRPGPGPVKLAPEFAEKLAAAGEGSFGELIDSHEPPDGHPVMTLAIEPFIENLADQRDWFRPGTGESNPTSIMSKGEIRTFALPLLPSPIIRQYGAMAYAGQPKAVRVRLLVGAALAGPTQHLDWTPEGGLSFERIDPLATLVPNEPSHFEVEALEDVEFKLLVMGFEGRPR